MRIASRTSAAWLTLLAILLCGLPHNSKAYDVLELPAVKSSLATHSLVYTVHQFYGKLYATGQHGHILYSEDAGESWQQAAVPVRSDLLDIYFPSPKHGWAVGHDGVILHSKDAGRSWEKQLDGFQLAQQGLEWYSRKRDENPAESFFGVLVEEMEFAIEQGADKPLFRVWFENDTHGYVLGAYGLMLETRDGGMQWLPIMEQLMYEQFVHLYDMVPLPEGFFIVGEMGVILQWSAETKRYELLESPYIGSLFTALAPQPGKLLVAGLRGKAFFKAAFDADWQVVEKPETGAVVDAISLADGQVLMITVDGRLLLSSDAGGSFRLLEFEYPGMLSGVVESTPGVVVLAGAAGLQRIALADVAFGKGN